MEKQLQTWEGEFGVAYTNRNESLWKKRKPAFKHMVGDLGCSHILEIGCNRGMNLEALQTILPEDCDIVGIEPNQYALKIARETSPRFGILHGNAYDLPFKNNFFDLVFTCTVLIHIPIEDLPKAIKEIYRVSGKYILAIEYFAEEETIIHYRGHDDLLWKRNFLKHYQDLFPNLTLRKEGYWDDKDGFDRCNWWLLEK